MNSPLLLCFVIAFVSSDEHWGYEHGEEELDPNHWYMKYKTCIGDRQSPIDIEKRDIVYDPTLKRLNFDGYHSLVDQATVTNDGHTVRIDLPDSCEAALISQSLNITYKLKQFHFHWGHTDDVGSEHVIFKKHYPLEMHLVHADETVSYDTALTEPFGLVVVSVLFTLGEPSAEMRKLTNSFKQIKDPLRRNSTTIKNIILRDYLPRHINNYLQYDGSLTTPPCNEAVKWIILTHTNSITDDQLHEFRSLRRVVNEGGQQMLQKFETNDRALQGIKNRKIRLYYQFDNLGH